MSSLYHAPSSNLINADEHSTLQAYKRYVITDQYAHWPGRCFKCNSPTEYKKEVKLYYLNPWWYLTILIAALITIIVYYVARKKIVIDLPMCDVHRKKRKNFIIFQSVLLVTFFASLVGSFVTAQDDLALFALLTFLVLVISAMAGRLIVVAKFKNGKAWVSGAGKPFLNSLPVFNKI